MKYFIGAVVVVVLAAAAWYYVSPQVAQAPAQAATSFEECVSQGNAVMESYPRQCIDVAGNHFTEDVTQTWEVAYANASEDDITANLEPGTAIVSPLTISGEARGSWFFEASFPVTLVDWDGKIIAEGYATAGSDWMTTDFVPFTATLEFTAPEKQVAPNRGAVILKRDNPSGLPEHDGALEIPVTFE